MHAAVSLTGSVFDVATGKALELVLLSHAVREADVSHRGHGDREKQWLLAPHL